MSWWNIKNITYITARLVRFKMPLTTNDSQHFVLIGQLWHVYYEFFKGNDEMLNTIACSNLPKCLEIRTLNRRHSGGLAFCLHCWPFFIFIFWQPRHVYRSYLYFSMPYLLWRFSYTSWLTYGSKEWNWICLHYGIWNQHLLFETRFNEIVIQIYILIDN